MPPKKKNIPAAPAPPKVVIKTQRKIRHLLDSREVRGEFKYLLRCNPKNGFNEGDPVLLTEKWDGTTVQATNRGIFKRLDLFQRGDPRKHEAPESERYRLVELDLEDAHNQQIARACERYTDTFRQLEDGMCIYFEALSDRIGARFSHLPNWADIRIFDSAKNGEYLPFDETIVLAETLNLPLVKYVDAEINLRDIIARLERGLEYDDIHAPLEGYVLRDTTEQGRIAKIRVADLPSMIRDD